MRPLATALLLALAYSQQAVAQKPDSTRRDTTVAARLQPIEVVGSILTAIAPRVGSGVPARTAIITKSEIEFSAPRLLTDLLSAQPGISTYDDLGAGRKVSLSYRGFFASPVVGLPQGISVFLDGIRQNEPDAAQVNFDLLPLQRVTRVELLSGTASLLGRNSLGGAINLVTDGGGGATRGEVELSGGSYTTFGSDASIAGSLGSGTWSYYVAGGYDRDDGWRQVTGSKQYNGFFNVGRLTAGWGIRLQGIAARSRAETAGSLPESMYSLRPDSNLSAHDYEDLNNLQVALSGYRRAGRGQFSASAYARRHRATRFNVNQQEDPNTLGLSRNRTVGGTADYRRELSVGTGRLDLRFGAEGSAGHSEVELFADSTKLAGDVVQTTFVKSPTWDVGTYAVADLTVGRLTLSAGVRYDLVTIPFRNQLNPARDTTSTYAHLSPRAGITVRLGGPFSAYGSLGGAFRAPAVIELACADPEAPCPLPFALGDDPPIRPVRAITFEVGGRMTTASLTLSASAYRTNVRDDIILAPSDAAPAGSTLDGFFTNLEKTRRQGVELSADLRLRAGHSVYASYAYTDATFESAAEIFSVREDFGGENQVVPGNKMPLVPAHQFKFGGSFQLPGGLHAGADARYLGSQYLRGDEANQEPKLDSYVVADARLGWRGRGWEMLAAGTNLFQAKYASFGTFNINQGGGGVLERFLTPGSRRTVRIIVRRHFGGAGA
ncbi:MAG: TonB-dependent receptor [Gemmatimonadota bacterium]